MAASVIGFPKKHWKKIVFGAVVLSCGSYYGNKKYTENELKRKYSEEARAYGAQPLLASQKPRHITVLLNPAAQDGTGRQLFEKFGAPLLHLAGIQVSIVKTEHDSQLKALMEVVDDTDAIIIAGGDGALSEAVTGLLRRPDQERIAKLAIGIAPIGKTNTIARRLFGSQLTNVQFIGEAMMAAIRDQRRAFDVIHIEGNQGKPVYALAELQWGPLRDAKERASKYWYLGPLKRRATYVISVMKEWPQYVRAKLSYVLPCEGCSKCYVAPPPPPPLRWWQSILRTESNKVPTSRDFSQVKNEECGMWHDLDIETINFSAATNNGLPKSQDSEADSMTLSVGSGAVTKTDFIKHGFQRHSRPVEAAHVTENDHKLVAREFRLEPEGLEDEEKQAWYTIDSEDYEALPVHVRLLPKRIQLFCNPEAT